MQLHFHCETSLNIVPCEARFPLGAIKLSANVIGWWCRHCLSPANQVAVFSVGAKYFTQWETGFTDLPNRDFSDLWLIFQHVQYIVSTFFYSYSFLSANGTGFEAFFTPNGHLVVAVVTRKEYVTAPLVDVVLADDLWVSYFFFRLKSGYLFACNFTSISCLLAFRAHNSQPIPQTFSSKRPTFRLRRWWT